LLPARAARRHRDSRRVWSASGLPVLWERPGVRKREQAPRAPNAGATWSVLGRADCAPVKGHTRQAERKPPGPNPNAVVQQSPGLARSQPWLVARQGPSTRTRLRPGGGKTGRLRCPPAKTPLGFRALPTALPRVAPSVQPWALLQNRVAVEARAICVHNPLARPIRAEMQVRIHSCAGIEIASLW